MEYESEASQAESKIQYEDYTGIDLIGETVDYELITCLVVAKETCTDFEKLYYQTDYSKVYRRYAYLQAIPFRPLKRSGFEWQHNSQQI